MMIKYTFLMPAYKAMYLKEAIESILAQSYKEFQLIVSDDCSPENLYAIVKEFDDERILYRRNSQNIGGENLVKHWNLLLDLAKSDYVILAPDDDLYAPAFLEEIDKLVNKYPNVNVFKSRVQKIDEYGEIIMKDRLYEEYVTQLDNIYHQTFHDHMSGIGNYVFKTCTLKSIGGFRNYPLAWWSDVMTNICLSDKGLVVSKDILFTMRLSGINISNRHNTSRDLRYKAEATMKFVDDIESIINALSSFSKSDEEKMRFFRNYCKQCLYDDLILGASTFSLKEIKKIIAQYWNIFNEKKAIIAFVLTWIVGRMKKV